MGFVHVHGGVVARARRRWPSCSTQAKLWFTVKVTPEARLHPYLALTRRRGKKSKGVEQRRAHHEGGHGDRDSGEDKNGEFALTVACLALQLGRGCREEDGEAIG